MAKKAKKNKKPMAKKDLKKTSGGKFGGMPISSASYR